MRGSWITQALVALLGGVLLYGCAPAYRGAPILEPLEPVDPQVLLGRQVFDSNCHQCHPGGATGLAPGITNKPLPDWAIRFQVRHGLGEMPAFSDEEISDEELHALVAYLNALRARLLESAAETEP
jgi:mono/diheme cytochrome c family protein